MEIIAVANQKGGCGKTITAVNLAGALAGIGKNVLFIDLDPQSHASSAFDVIEYQPSKSSYFIYEAFLDGDIADISALMQQKYSNLWIIGSHILLSTMEQKMANIKNAVLALSSALKSECITQKFDYVILDTPPNLGFLTLNALHAANRVIVPLDVSFFSLNGVSQIDGLLELAKNMGFRKPRVNFLITLFDGRSNFAKDFLQKAKERFSDQLMQTVIRQNIKLREAAQAGKVIFEYAPWANGAKDYTALAKELVPEFKEEVIHMKPREIIHMGAPLPEMPEEIFFKLYAPEAKSVYLAGSFNNWTVDNSSLMKRLDNGMWVKILPLSKGNYAYKFVVDGKWMEDPGNDITEINTFGGKNSVLLIKTN